MISTKAEREYFRKRLISHLDNAKIIKHFEKVGIARFVNGNFFKDDMSIGCLSKFMCKHLTHC